MPSNADIEPHLEDRDDSPDDVEGIASQHPAFEPTHRQPRDAGALGHVGLSQAAPAADRSDRRTDRYVIQGRMVAPLPSLQLHSAGLEIIDRTTRPV